MFMTKTREDVIEEFHKKFGIEIDKQLTVKLLELRRALIDEEVKELFSDMDTAISHLKKGEEIPKELYANMLKELSDVQTVISGTAVSLNPFRKLDEAFVCVHKSNMSKLGDDGKVLKGKNYIKPNLSEMDKLGRLDLLTQNFLVCGVLICTEMMFRVHCQYYARHAYDFFSWETRMW